jgi:hypothetical protein
VTGAALVGRLDASGAVPGDLNLFAHAGSTLLSSHWRLAFQQYQVQAGPLELVLASLARTIGGGGQLAWAIVLDLTCTAAIVAAAVVVIGRRPLPLLGFGVAAYALWLPGDGYLGHPAELLIPVLWIFAAREARRGRPSVAGVLVGLSGCFELWGVLGVTVLGLAPRLRRCVPGAALAVALPVASLLPFVLSGHFGMFHYAWFTRTGVPRLVFGSDYPFTWPLRVAEGAIVCALVFPLARAVRRFHEAVWLVPAAAALCRIALDPIDFGYYWNAPLVAAVIGAAAVISRRKELSHRFETLFGSATAS